NGVLVATNTNQTTGNIQASPGKMLCIGAYNGSSTFLYGLVDEVKIYPFALTPQQINQDYLQERNGISTSSTMVDEETNIGEQWRCAITPSNSFYDGLTKTSNIITIPS
ncbi:MAG TPA: LamG-like jellyroll fold domain-containing protein, partial [Candidatus Thermoplasmatota archaeon]|nr:LamG-like jellyroll fold domain-containing protein [Candidatus Thermoplasmatota archaeon]